MKFIKETRINFILNNTCTVILFIIALCSCSEKEIFNNETFSTQRLNINFRIATLANPETRDLITCQIDESKINNLTILIFDNDNQTLLQREEVINSIFSNNKGNFSYSFDLNYNVSVSKGFKVYAIANTNTSSGDLIEEFKERTSKTLSDLEELISQSCVDNENGLLMSGILSENNELVLNRNGIKITVRNNSDNPKFDLKGFEIVNTSSHCYILSGITNQVYDDNTKDRVSGIELKSENEIIYNAYINPTKNGDEGSLNPIVILKAEFGGEECWYSLMLKKEGRNLDLLSNSWFRININGVKSKGYLSFEDALLNSDKDEDSIDIEIIDNESSSLSIISDGIRSLGTINELKVPENQTELEISVNMICQDPTENGSCNHYPILEANPINPNPSFHQIGDNYNLIIEEGKSWITIMEVEESANENCKSWKYKFKLNPENTIGGNLTGLIRVNWEGLSREIKVVCSSSFTYRKLFLDDVYLLTHFQDENGEDTYYYINGYWKFLNGTNSEILRSNKNTLYPSIQLYGSSKADMGLEKVRNEGFHFPVMYGEKNNKWWYEYLISMFTSTILKEYKFYSISIKQNNKTISENDKIWGADKLYINSLGTINNAQPEIGNRIKSDEKIELNGVSSINLSIKRAIYDEGKNTYSGIDDDFGYSIAQLVVTLYKENDERGSDYSVNLYHTGFFHIDPDAIDQGVYYYEVVEQENGKYWLDRNIRATSNGFDILNDKGSIFSYQNYPINWNSTGDYLKLTKDQNGNLSLSGTACPPGYRIPTKDEFNEVIKSSRFKNKEINDENGLYFSTSYNTADVLSGKIYFPKSRLKVKNSLSGDIEAGYYWTQTPWNGLLKQYGDFGYNVMYVKEESSGFIEGDISSQDMVVRCIADF